MAAGRPARRPQRPRRGRGQGSADEAGEEDQLRARTLRTRSAAGLGAWACRSRVHLLCACGAWWRVGEGQDDNNPLPCSGHSVDGGNVHRNNKDAGRLAGSGHGLRVWDRAPHRALH